MASFGCFVMRSLGPYGYGAKTVAMTAMMTTMTMMGPGTRITSDQEERVRNESPTQKGHLDKSELDSREIDHAGILPCFL